MLENRIRHYRQKKGLTLAELGDLIGTTPQSVSRLETGVMKLSLDWVEKIASALEVAPQALIGNSEQEAIPLVGIVDAQSYVLPLKNQSVSFAAGLKDPVGVQMEGPLGPFENNDVVIFERGIRADAELLNGKICLVALTEDQLRLGRIASVPRDDGPPYLLLVPLDTRDQAVCVDDKLWIAVLRLQCRAFDIS